MWCSKCRQCTVCLTKMDALPNELLEKILAHLPYREQGGCLAVSRHWNRVIERLLPFMRSVNITAKDGCFGEYSSAALDIYTLFSSYKGNLVYVSKYTHTSQSSLENDNCEEKKKMYLFKMEKVNLLSEYTPNLRRGDGL